MQEPSEQNNGEQAASSSLVYAGFWRRLAAHVIDQVVLLVVFVLVDGLILISLIITTIFDSIIPPLSSELASSGAGDRIAMGLVLGLSSLAITWVYYAALESSKFQA